MLTLEQIKEKLKDRKIQVVADATGLHYHTIRRAALGIGKSISYAVVKKLSDYFEANQ